MSIIKIYLIAIIAFTVLCIIGGWFLLYDRIRKHIEKHKGDIPITTDDKSNGALWKGILIGVIIIIVILAVRELLYYLMGMGSLLWLMDGLWPFAD